MEKTARRRENMPLNAPNSGGGIITVSIPYTAKDGEDTSKLVVWYLADDDALEPMNGKYNAETKCYEFNTTQLSTYVLTSFPFTDVAADSYYLKQCKSFLSGRTRISAHKKAPCREAGSLIVREKMLSVISDQNVIQNLSGKILIGIPAGCLKAPIKTGMR